MNRLRRKELKKAEALLEKARLSLDEAMEIVETCMSEEEEYRDYMPENLQGSERYEAADMACDRMQEALDFIQDFDVEDAISALADAAE